MSKTLIVRQFSLGRRSLLFLMRAWDSPMFAPAIAIPSAIISILLFGVELGNRNWLHVSDTGVVMLFCLFCVAGIAHDTRARITVRGKLGRFLKRRLS